MSRLVNKVSGLALLWSFIAFVFVATGKKIIPVYTLMVFATLHASVYVVVMNSDKDKAKSDFRNFSLLAIPAFLSLRIFEALFSGFYEFWISALIFETITLASIFMVIYFLVGFGVGRKR
ncbi:MAG: hypothetical protein ACOY3X_03935 [Pseudomonadota bacterium]